MRVILALLISMPAIAALPKAFKYELMHQKTNLTVEWDGRVLKAHDREMKNSITLKKCNQKLLTEFFAVDEVMWRDRPVATPDPVKVKRGTEAFSVSTKSRMGQYLLTLSDQLKILKAEENLACKIK